MEDEKISFIVNNGGHQKRKQCPMHQEDEAAGDGESSKKQKLENGVPSPCSKSEEDGSQRSHNVSMNDSIGSRDTSLMETGDASSLPNSQESNTTSLGGSESQERFSRRNNPLKNALSEFETVQIDQVHDYLGQLFEFRDLQGDEWKLPLFTDKAFSASQTFLVPKKKDRIETKGKTNLQVLYEYVQKESKEDSKVIFKKIEMKGLTEFYTEIVVAKLKYGIGKGDTFKIAKHDASKVTLDILNPKLVPKEDDEPEVEEVYQVNIDYAFLWIFKVVMQGFSI